MRHGICVVADSVRFTTPLLFSRPVTDVLMVIAGLCTSKLYNLADGYETIMCIVHFWH